MSGTNAGNRHEQRTGNVVARLNMKDRTMVRQRDAKQIRRLDALVRGADQVTVSKGGHDVEISGELLAVIQRVMAALDMGETVTVITERPADRELSSQDVADLLNVSRPHVVKLARTGQLPHHMVGNRHRFALSDVLLYESLRRQERDGALSALAPEAGYTAEDF